MKRIIIIIPFTIFLFFIICCSKGVEEPMAQTERELSVPEKVEQEIMDVLSKDWQTLSDTLHYFDSTMLSKGRFKGIAPDGVYYELAFRKKDEYDVDGDFSIEDSIWVAINGRTVPLGICVSAFEYLTACITDRFEVANYFTSPTLRGVPGDTYLLHVRWLDYEASAVCTIPEPPSIDTVYVEKVLDDTSFVAKMVFHNNPSAGTLYQTFSRVGSESNAYKAVNFTTLDGSMIDDIVVETFMKPLEAIGKDDAFFHPGDTIALKLATVERPMYDFWKEYANYSNSSGSVFGVSKNVKGNVSGAIGYWAGYGIDIKELILTEKNKDLGSKDLAL